MSEYLDYLQKRNPLSRPYRTRLLYPAYASMLPGLGLDVGCGLGEFLHGRESFVGVDIDADIVAHCRAKGLNVSQGGADALPFADGRFDAVLLDNVLEHLHEPQACMAEIKRALKPGGRALIVVPNRSGYARDKTHVTYWDETNLPALVRDAGLKPVKARHFPIPLKWLGNLIWPYNVYYLLAEKPRG